MIQIRKYLNGVDIIKGFNDIDYVISAKFYFELRSHITSSIVDHILEMKQHRVLPLLYRKFNEPEYNL